MDADTRKRATTKLKGIAGENAGVQRMPDGDRSCTDVLNQLATVRVALDSHKVECLSPCFQQPAHPAGWPTGRA
jgi:DNA-binding FrmR family transcriptional regulator